MIMDKLLIADEILKLKQLLDMGVLTQEEFDTQKVRLLSNENTNESIESNNIPENDLYRVVLLAANHNDKIRLIKAIREMTGLGLKETKHLVDTAPQVVVSGLTKQKAEEIYSFIEAHGGIPNLEIDNNATRNDSLDQYDFSQLTSDAVKRDEMNVGAKCPTCGSTRLKKLDVVDRSLSFAVFGFGSNKVGKSFKCKNCGYTW